MHRISLTSPCGGFLEMHAPDRAGFCVERSAILRVIRLQAVLFEGIRTKCARKIAALVPDEIELYQKKTGKARILKLHLSIISARQNRFNSGTATTNFPPQSADMVHLRANLGFDVPR